MRLALPIILIVLVAAIVAWVAWGMLRGAPVETAVASVGPIDERVEERGRTRLPREYVVTMPRPGRIAAIELVENTPVQQGQEVARLVESDLDVPVAAAQAAYEQAVAALREAEDTAMERTLRAQAEEFVESMRATVEAAETRLAAGEERVRVTQANERRVLNLFERGVTTEDDRDQAQLQRVEAEVNYEQDKLVYRATAAVLAATELLPRVVDDMIGRRQLTANAARQRVAEARAELDRVSEQRRRGVMTSPVDGIVLERLIVDEQELAAGTVLLRLGRREELEVETDILSQDVVRVRVGQAAEIYGPAIGQPTARATVHRIHPAGFTEIGALGVEQQRVTVILRFESGELERLLAERNLGVAYRVSVRIVTDRRERALRVSRAAVFRGLEGQWQVYVIRDGRARLVDVEIGLMNDQWAEIRTGLTEGEQVILSPEAAIEDGTRVRGNDE